LVYFVMHCVNFQTSVLRPSVGWRTTLASPRLASVCKAPLIRVAEQFLAKRALCEVLNFEIVEGEPPFGRDCPVCAECCAQPGSIISNSRLVLFQDVPFRPFEVSPT
jgi:hypothetical protein